MKLRTLVRLSALLSGAFVACSATPTATSASTDGGSVWIGPDASPSDGAPAREDAAPPPPVDAGADEDAGAGADSARAPLALASSAFTDGGALATTYTCDGAGRSPPLAWRGGPAAAGYALLMTTVARDGLKWNWVLYGIPATTTSLAEASTGVGMAGLTSDGPALAYSPPCSQGPGAKEYTFTLYALSGAPTLPAVPNQVTGAVLEAAIAPFTLEKASIRVTVTR